MNCHPIELTVTMDAVQATKAMRAIKTINKAALKSCKLGFALHIPHAASFNFSHGAAEVLKHSERPGSQKWFQL